jgi:hypothetical protein
MGIFKKHFINFKYARRQFLISQIDVCILDIMNDFDSEYYCSRSILAEMVADRINSKSYNNLIYERINYLEKIQHLECCSCKEDVSLSGAGRLMVVNQSVHFAATNSFFSYSNFLLMRISVLVAILSIVIATISFLYAFLH